MGVHDQQCLFGWAWRKREMTEFVDQKSTGGALRPTLNPDPHDEKATMHPLKVFFRIIAAMLPSNKGTVDPKKKHAQRYGGK